MSKINFNDSSLETSEENIRNPPWKKNEKIKKKS